MSSPLSALPVDKRKQLAATLGLFSTLFVAVGAVAATGPATAVIRAFVVVAILVAVLLALMAWGVVHSVRVDAAESTLDVAIEQAIAAAPRKFAQMCNCGHEHDPTELHITDADEPAPAAAVSPQHTATHEHTAACAHDGAGAACAHDCESCMFGAAGRFTGSGSTDEPALRPSPNRTRAERLSR